MKIEELLQEREARYGSFREHAELCQSLKDVMRASPGWLSLDSDMMEALEMIQHKIARILNGDPTYPDNFLDVAGYATLVANRLSEK